MKIARVIKSFSFAINGIFKMAANERNFKIELYVAGIFFLVGLLLGFYYWEWLVIFAFYGLVLSLEMVNSSIETLCNLLREKMNLKYEDTTLIRNLAAGSVFLSTIFSAIAGVLIIINHL